MRNGFLATLAISGAFVSATSLLAETIPFANAKVTRIENSVAVGALADRDREPRAVKVDDDITAKDYVVTKTESRAELKFPDTSLVRIGQNTVFTFDAASRTLDLKRGSMLFYVKPGTGGGTIKTPTLTAAITGTICKVSENMIAVLKGHLSTKWGNVPQGYAIEWDHGTVRIFKFDPAEATSGKLYAFGGPLPDDIDLPGSVNFPPPPDLRSYDIKEITQVNPRVERELKNKSTPKPTASQTPEPNVTPTPPPTPRPTPTPEPTGRPSPTATDGGFGQ